MGLLGDIFSAIDSKKRKIRGLLDDPAGEFDAAVRRFRDDQRGLLDTFATGYQLPGYKSVLTTPQQVAAAKKAIADQGADMGMAAATVWHGSPHKFDKFDSSKIGTGEGAQAYGHGLYLAENPGVARGYGDKLSYHSDTGLRGARVDVSPAFRDVEWNLGLAKQYLLESGGDVNKALSKLGKLEDQWKVKKYVTHTQEGFDLQRKALQNGGLMYLDPSFLYKVDLPDEAIAKMLDWDKPLSQQAPEVKAALDKSGFMQYADEYFKQNRKTSPTAADLHDFLKYSGYGQNEIAPRLADQGIPGIRYLDGGSRGAGAGTSNYVIFPGNENLLTILERNGQGLLGN